MTTPAPTPPEPTPVDTTPVDTPPVDSPPDDTDTPTGEPVDPGPTGLPVTPAPIDPAPVDPAPAAGDPGRWPVEVIRSEERLRVVTESVPAHRARLRRRVITESRTITVELRREIVELVGEPMDSSFVGTIQHAGDGPATEWMTISEEQVQITKTVVPVERARLVRATVTEPQQVSAPVSREEIAIEGPGL